MQKQSGLFFLYPPDSNNLPVKIKGQMDFTDGSYVKQVNFTDINLVPGASYGADQGYGVDDSLNIASPVFPSIL